MATEREALVALNLVPEMGPIAWRKLLGVFGSAAAVLAATEDDLRDRAGFGAQRAAALAEAMRGADPTRELSLAAKTGIKIIVKCDPEYP